MAVVQDRTAASTERRKIEKWRPLRMPTTQQLVIRQGQEQSAWNSE